MSEKLKQLEIITLTEICKELKLAPTRVIKSS